jgi:hypothetical protein
MYGSSVIKSSGNLVISGLFHSKAIYPSLHLLVADVTTIAPFTQPQHIISTTSHIHYLTRSFTLYLVNHWHYVTRSFTQPHPIISTTSFDHLHYLTWSFTLPHLIIYSIPHSIGVTLPHRSFTLPHSIIYNISFERYITPFFFIYQDILYFFSKSTYLILM